MPLKLIVKRNLFQKRFINKLRVHAYIAYISTRDQNLAVFLVMTKMLLFVIEPYFCLFAISQSPPISIGVTINSAH